MFVGKRVLLIIKIYYSTFVVTKVNKTLVIRTTPLCSDRLTNSIGTTKTGNKRFNLL